jgi:hypothetical protein
LSIIYRKAKNAADLVIKVQESADMESEWTDATGSASQVSDNGTVETIRFTAPAGTAAKKFLRVSVAPLE